MAAGAWLFFHAEKSGGIRVPAGIRAGDITHEKVFLNEQLRREPKHTPILLRLAQIERSEGDLGAARKHVEQAAAADEQQVDVHLELGLVCWEMGDFAAAEEQNRAVLRIDPGQPDALYNLGAISANSGRVRQAREFWIEAVRTGRKRDSVDQSRRAVERLEAMR